MGILRRIGVAAVTAPPFAASAGAALAEAPRNWQMGLDRAASPIMQQIVDFHNLLLVITGLITVLVLVLLFFVIYRFAERRNPTPSATTHNTIIEVLWTAVPVVILMVIAIPSFKLLYDSDRIEDAEMTIKAIGRQWYWSYEYPDDGNFTFDSTMVATEDLKEGQINLLDTDNYVVLPVNTRIRLLVTASDVLHAFALPALGIKLDAVPGRVNETWVEITREGTYYGQCSEICGAGHSYMPIALKAVSKEAYAEWLAKARVDFARAEGPAQTAHLANTRSSR